LINAENFALTRQACRGGDILLLFRNNILHSVKKATRRFFETPAEKESVKIFPDVREATGAPITTRSLVLTEGKGIRFSACLAQRVHLLKMPIERALIDKFCWFDLGLLEYKACFPQVYVRARSFNRANLKRNRRINHFQFKTKYLKIAVETVTLELNSQAARMIRMTMFF